MKIVVKGKPIPQRRPEIRIWKGKAMGYDPSAQNKKEILTQLWADTQLSSLEMLTNCPVRVQLDAYMPIPKSLSQKKQKELDGTPHIKRPDWDNIFKLYSDILEGYAYEKDSQICDISGKKEYSFDPRVEIYIIKG